SAPAGRSRSPRLARAARPGGCRSRRRTRASPLLVPSFRRPGFNRAPRLFYIQLSRLYNAPRLSLNARELVGTGRLQQTPTGEDTMARARRLFATFIASAAGLALLAMPPARAQDKTFELKLSHWVPPSHPLQKAIEEWSASVEKDSNGTIKSKIYP